MNFCAALYTRSFLYIFVCALLLVRGTLQKAASETSTPIRVSLSLSLSLPFSLFLLTFLFPLRPTPSLPSVCFLVITTVILSYRSPPPLLLPYFSSSIRAFIFDFLTFIAPYSCLPCLRKAPQIARCPSQPHRVFCCV